MIQKEKKRRNKILKEVNEKGGINKMWKKIKMLIIAKNLNNYLVVQAQKIKILYQLECSLRLDK